MKISINKQEIPPEVPMSQANVFEFFLWLKKKDFWILIDFQ